MIKYSIIIATRNRIDQLSVSIPLFLNQTRLASRIIVVDASDDHKSIISLCESISKTFYFTIEVIQSHKANLPYQRNLGLDLITEEVIIYPDDDSFWYPDTAEKIMAVYDRDKLHLIGGVTGIETIASPLLHKTKAPKKSKRFVQHPTLSRIRGKIEDLLFPVPFNVYGKSRIEALSTAARSAGLTDVFVETMGGYRMSFRTEVIRSLRFDEVLGFGIGYAIHEDKDLSLRVMKAGYLLAAADGAKVFHNVHVGKRAQGFEYGFYHILNYIYIMRKLVYNEEFNNKYIIRYLLHKIALYGLRKSSKYNRDVYYGAKSAIKHYKTIMSASILDSVSVYQKICEKERQTNRMPSNPN